MLRRWEQIRIEKAALDLHLARLNDELRALQAVCHHGLLPKRTVIQDYVDQCPDCGHVVYCKRLF